MATLLQGVDLSEFWSFDGSLTTPPCTEGVKWTVVKDVQPISDAQLAAFTAYYADDPSFAAGKGNNRVTQPLNSRIVYFASGMGATAVGGDIAIPWDAWLSWGVGGAIMLFVIGAIIW